MKKKKSLLPLGLILLSLTKNVFSAGANNVSQMNWNGLEVVWLQDERFPTYDLSIYFSDGALSDNKRRSGETEAMFAQLDSGTNRYTQNEISDNLEFYGVGLDSNVTHEYSTLNVSGLVKDIVPTMKKICHLFNDAVFPKKEWRNKRKRAINALQSLVSNHSALADRAFRELSLKGSDYSQPTGGKISTLKRIERKHLLAKKDYFNNKVKKRLYLSGPKGILTIKDIITSECGWNLKESTFSRKDEKPGILAKSKQPVIYLIPVKKANQVQIRMGRFLNSYENFHPDLLALASSYLGGGFTSKLMQEVRVKRGLSYGIGAFAGLQANYGRAGISTSTKNEKTEEILSVIKNVIEETSNNVSDKEFQKSIGFLSGNHLFQFEQNSAYLSKLLFFDHVGRNYSEIYDFPKTIKGFTAKNISGLISKTFRWENQSIIVVGNKSVAKILKKVGKVKILKANNFL